MLQKHFSGFDLIKNVKHLKARNVKTRKDTRFYLFLEIIKEYPNLSKVSLAYVMGTVTFVSH